MGEEATKRLAAAEAAKLSAGQSYLRGLYTGGTLCDEAMKLTIGTLGRIYSNIPLTEADELTDKDTSREHTCLDFGDDAFTVGRPHPMIDPSLRNDRLVKEAADPQTAVILLDNVIGYGAHENAAAELAGAIIAAKEAASESGRYLPVVVSVCGTERDPQSLSRSAAALEAAGAVVMPSNAQAVRLALSILEMGGCIV